ncbi:hypothetical protein [Ruegeria sp. ANG-S4]|uniref:hypothetical protein n=1 Tax=Ruegeria sp. ANG-S4 TaxID=1577904 RepID=UPI000B163DB8|nr:hypothetical protein [Ruegeria sp. ANG-S4]
MLKFEQLKAPDPAPLNLLPAGLPCMIGGLAKPDTVSTVFYRTHAGALYIEDFDPHPSGADPFSDLWPAIDAAHSDVDRTAPISLGPRGARSQSGGCALELVTMAKTDPPDSDDVEIGIIDAGIAFWNPAFRVKGAGTSCRFSSYGALKLSDKQFVGEALTSTEIEEFCARSDSANRLALVAKYPESVFGDTARWPLVRPQGLAHGTAMAEMVLSTAPETARLHGLELPVSVLRDLSGGQMTALMEIAVRALVEQVLKTRNQTGRSDNKQFKLVVLMAFGFTGGPLDGTAKGLNGLEGALTYYKEKGIDLELVLPIGNQLQDQLHARLAKGESVGWRVLPDDHSANTVEVIRGKDQPALKIAPPGGEFVKIPDTPGLFRIIVDDMAIGGVWTETLNGDRVRTRIALVPTAATRPRVPIAPFGKWRLACDGDAADLWILRDETGFEADPFQPQRPSWFEDHRYNVKDKFGMPALEDAPHRPGDPLSVVRRDGSASVLASSTNGQIRVVTAVLGDGQPAFYASMLPNGQTADDSMSLEDAAPSMATYDLQPIGPFLGRAVLGNGGKDRFRAAGTSLASARMAGKIASM